MMRIPRFLVKKQGFNTFKKPPHFNTQPPHSSESWNPHHNRPPLSLGCEKHHTEHGSAIIWILIAIALFAALNFVVTSGSRTGTQNIS